MRIPCFPSPMKRLFHLVLVLPAVLLLGAVEDLPNTSPVPGTAAKTTPFGRPSLGVDLGLEMAGPLSQPVLALRDGPKTEFERDRIEALLQVHRAKARPAEHLTPEMLAQQVADVEQYIVEYPDGEWTPGLRVEMGKFYRTTGRFSKYWNTGGRPGRRARRTATGTGNSWPTRHWHAWPRC